MRGFARAFSRFGRPLRLAGVPSLSQRAGVRSMAWFGAGAGVMMMMATTTTMMVVEAAEPKEENEQKKEENLPLKDKLWKLLDPLRQTEIVKGAKRYWDVTFHSLFGWAAKQKPVIPPPAPVLYRPPFVVILDLQLFWQSSDRGGGWRTQKRAGTDYFLAQTAQLAEIVAFDSTLAPNVGWTLISKMDPMGVIRYKFFKDFERDVSSLKRPADRIIIFGQDPADWPGYEGNVVVVPRFDPLSAMKSEEADAVLLDCSTFLQQLLQEQMAQSGWVDVRIVLKNFRDKKNDPLDWARRIRLEIERRKQEQAGTKKLIGAKR